MKSNDIISIDMTGEELSFLYWCMKFLEGGPFDKKKEDQRENFEFKINQTIKNYKEGFLHKLNNGEIFIECAFCKGDGIFPETPSSDEIETLPCPVCNGKGFNKIKTAQKNIIKCRFCGGKGKAWDSNGYATGDVCQVCQGTGVVSLEDDTENSENNNLWTLLHPVIMQVTKSRFESNHYSDAVEAAYKEINTVIKEIVKSKTGEEIDGASLMNRAFSRSQPVIRLSDLSTDTGRNIQQGYMQIFAGAMTGIRNPKAHKNEEINRTLAIQLLTLASLLMFTLDKRI